MFYRYTICTRTEQADTHIYTYAWCILYAMHSMLVILVYAWNWSIRLRLNTFVFIDLYNVEKMLYTIRIGYWLAGSDNRKLIIICVYVVIYSTLCIHIMYTNMCKCESITLAGPIGCYQSSIRFGSVVRLRWRLNYNSLNGTFPRK